MNSRQIIIINIVSSFLMLTTARADTRLKKYVDLNWKDFRYLKSVSVNKLSNNKNVQYTKEELRLSCEIKIKDPNIVLGTCDRGIVTQLTDKNGQKIDLIKKLPKTHFSSYHGPYYNQRYIKLPETPRWKKFLLSIAGRKLKTQIRHKSVFEITPNQISIELDTRLIEKAGGEIKSLKGYINVLTARWIEYLDVPFEPNSNWINLTPDTQVRICDAQFSQSMPGISYRYEIEQRWRNRKRLPHITVGDNVPKRIVIGYQLIDKNGKTIYFSDRRRIPADVYGQCSGTDHSNTAPIKKIRFLTAAKARHQKMPFEFKNIPIPNPSEK